MEKKIVKEIIILTSVLFMAVFFTGCSQHVVKPQLKSQFDQKIENLVSETIKGCKAQVIQIAPAAIVSKAVLDGKPYSRLDEIIIQRLETRLSSEREIVNLSRENWFELREAKPLSLKGHSYAHSDFLEDSVVFIVDVEPDGVFEQIKVAITANNSDSRKIPGIKAKTLLEYKKESPGTMLLKEPAKSNPLPAGLKENPYASMEQLCYSLASELSSSLKRGVKSGKYKAFDDEIQVVLCSSSFKSTDPMFKSALIQELQQALVSMDGMTSAVSREDFKPVFSQIDFYKQNDGFFEKDNEKFKPGSVLLMAETKSHRYSDLKHVALRAVWRVTPLKDKNGEFIPQNSAGTYVSGFTSRAWFNGDIPTVLKNKSYKSKDYQSMDMKKKKNQSSDKGFD
jgi:hypothetical protein